MAIVTAGVQALDFRTLSTSGWSSLTFTTRTASYLVADERLLGAPGTKLEFWGSGLAFDAAGHLIAGKVFAYQESVGGQVTYRVDNLAVSASCLMSWANSGQPTLALQNSLGGNDSVCGTAGNDYLSTYGGADTIAAGAGNDTILGGAGDDRIDGGAGIDTAILSGSRSDYTLVHWNGTVGVVPKTKALLASDGVDQLINIEKITFSASGETIDTSAANFSPLDYIASYRDLGLLIGANAKAGFEHFLHYGAAEGRHTSFSGAEYIASYQDLTTAFGSHVELGAKHFLEHGQWEGRAVNFSGLAYIASYADLITTLHADRSLGALDYIEHGRALGRHATFDGLLYIAANRDLIPSLGIDADAGAEHYILHGYAEGRHASFNAKQYLANYVDLRAAFGSDIDMAAKHFILHGLQEGRTDAVLI